MRDKLIKLFRCCPGMWVTKSAAQSLADHMIAHGVTVQEWISVKDRLPQCGERVLITEGNAVFEASLSISHKWVRCGIGWAENVTHWQALPQPPKMEVV